MPVSQTTSKLCLQKQQSKFMPLNISQIRTQFPALSILDNGQSRIYLDNPAGTQVSKRVIDRMTQYLVKCNANDGGKFTTSVESDTLLSAAHQAVAALLNAPSPAEIVFGANMTTLTYNISRCLAHWFEPGDEILLTRMDHDANVCPWLQMASERDLKVKWLNFSPETYCYDMEALPELLSDRTKLVAVNCASNVLGTINDVKKITDLAHSVGALVYVDAVHYVPHAPTDVQAIGCDFLVCSAYKFCGPHQGVLWGKGELLEKLQAYNVRPVSQIVPTKFETGTQNHEGQVGTLGAIEHLLWIGKTMACEYHQQYSQYSESVKYIHAAMAAIQDYEQRLSWHLVSGLQAIPGVTVHGITEAGQMHQRVPTVCFTRKGFQPGEISASLAKKNIFVWDGDFYAIEVVKGLGVDESGGLVRVGAVHYSTLDEIDKLLEGVETL